MLGHQLNQLAGIVGVGCVTFFHQPLGGLFSSAGVVAAFVVFEVFVPVVNEVDDAGQQIGEVNEAVGDRHPLVVDELLGFGVAARALKAEEVVAA